MPQSLGKSVLLPQIQSARELRLQVPVPRAKGVAEPVVGAVLGKLIPVVIAPRAEQDILECTHPHSHRLKRQRETWRVGDLVLLDPRQFGAKSGQSGMSNGANEGLEFRLDLESVRTLQDRADLDDLHL